MSVNSTPRGYSSQNIPAISSAEFLKAQQEESKIPSQAIQKLKQIVDEYFKLKPQLTNKESQIKGLFAYNQKMMQTIQKFMQHEKKVIKKYNKLCHIYVKNFKEYWNAKNVDVNFKDLINPITSISENFSMNQWKIEIEPVVPQAISPKYEEMLLTAFKKFYLNENHALQVMLEKEEQRLQRENKHVSYSHLVRIKQEIKQLHSITPTAANMFDLLQRRKNIQNLIKEMDQRYYEEFSFNDLNYIDQVARIQNIFKSPTQQKLRSYLDHEAQIRRSLKKKRAKLREQFEQQLQNLHHDNKDLKEEIDELKKRNVELEREYHECRNNYQMLDMKKGIIGRKKERNSSNTSIIEETLNNGMKETNKKLETKITELQNQITQLKQQLLEKQETNKQLNVKRELQHSNSQMDELRLKLSSKLMQMGILDTYEMTSGEMFDKIMEKMLEKQQNVKHYEVRDPTANQNNEYIDIKITQSLPLAQAHKQNNHQQAPLLCSQQSPTEKYHSSQQHSRQKYSEKKSDIILEDQYKDLLKTTGQNQIRSTRVQAQEAPVYAAMTRSEPLKINEEQGRQSSGKNRKKYTSPISSQGLLSISQRKSVQEESKMQDISKVFKENKSQEKQAAKIQDNSKIQEYLTTIRVLQDKNRSLTLEYNNLQRQVAQLQELLAQRKRKSPSVFESIQNQLKAVEKDHASQIQNVCQSIVRQLQRLQGDDFVRMMANMQDVIKGFKSSSFIPPSNPNINQIPVLSKNMTEQQDNLFKSQNLMAQLFLGKKQLSNNRKFSIPAGDKSSRLSLQSGEVKLLIKYERSIYFGLKQPQPQSSEQLYAPRIIQSKVKNSSVGKQQSSLRFDQDQLVDIVNEFEGRSTKKKQPNLSQNSLRLSQSNLRNSRQSDIKSSLKLIDKIDRKIIQDNQFVTKLQQKLQEIKNNSQSGNDLYWFYKKYRQAMQALQSTEAKLKQFHRKKDTCMNRLMEEDADLSRYKLEEKIHFLQQRVRGLEQQLVANKEEYDTNMTEKIKNIDQFKETALTQLIKGIFSENYAFPT